MKNLLRALGALLLLGVVAIGGWYWLKSHKSKGDAKDAPLEIGGLRIVKFAYPQARKNTTLTARQLCILEPLYRAELNSRLAGIVKTVGFDIGDKVKKGTILIELDVPDVAAEVSLKEEMVLQKKAEYETAKANNSRVQVGLETAKSRILQAEAQIKQSEALRDYRKKKLDRFVMMAKQDNVSGDLVDEQAKEFEGAVAALELAQANLGQARNQLLEKQADILATGFETTQKGQAIEVAQKDLGRSKAQLQLSQIMAPFDGVITHRRVGPGDFVSPPSGVSRDPMMIMATDQQLTIKAKFPDSVIVGLSDNTKMEATFDQVPGLVIAGKISRFAPMISATDRSVLVEVDLDTTGGKASPGAIPVPKETAMKLVLGITGTMKLKLESLGDAAVIPSGALFSRQGKQNLFLVVDNKVRMVPVLVQLDDGRNAVVQITPPGEKSGQARHLLPTDKVVLTRQSELTDGEQVDAHEEKP